MLRKASLKRCVFSCDLNCERVGALQSEGGREFQTLGAVKENDRSPTVFMFLKLYLHAIVIWGGAKAVFDLVLWVLSGPLLPSVKPYEYLELSPFTQG